MSINTLRGAIECYMYTCAQVMYKQGLVFPLWYNHYMYNYCYNNTCTCAYLVWSIDSVLNMESILEVLVCVTMIRGPQSQYLINLSALMLRKGEEKPHIISCPAYNAHTMHPLSGYSYHPCTIITKSLAWGTCTLVNTCNITMLQCVKLTVATSPMVTENYPLVTYFVLPGAILGD